MDSQHTMDDSSHKSLAQEEETAGATQDSEPKEPSREEGLQTPTEQLKGEDVQRSDTPNTFVATVGNTPDITLLCEQCRLYVSVQQLKHHRSFHTALRMLHCKTLPKSSHALLKKRNAILQKMKTEATVEQPISTKLIQRVNDAYELLKCERNDTFDEHQRFKETVDLSCNATALDCSTDCVYALGMCSSPNSRFKSEMEDVMIYQDSFGEASSTCYLGLFDGYHGRFSAEVAGSLLHRMLLHEMMKFDESLKPAPEQAYDAFTDISHHSFVFGAHAKLDGQFQEDGKEKSRAGCGGETTIPTGRSVALETTDDDFTQRVIQLCEEKYDKLVNESLISPSRKASASEGSAKHPRQKDMAQAFHKAYHLLDILLSYGQDEWSKVRWSGCSALSLVLTSLPRTEGDAPAAVNAEPAERDPHITHSLQAKEESKEEAGCEDENTEQKESDSKRAEPSRVIGHIHLANAGDTRALLIRGNRPYRLSKDHSPANPKEKERVLRQGGTLSSSEVQCRVNGVLSTTRGLGNHGDPQLKRVVLVEPYTRTIQLDQYAQFVVMATEGVWDVLTDTEVASLLLRMLPCNEIPPPSHPCSSMAGLLSQPARAQTSFGLSDTGTGSRKVEFANSVEGEKGADDAANSEKEATGEDTPTSTDGGTEKTGPQPERATIQADLKTEAGSCCGEGEDEDIAGTGDSDVVTLPVHSTLTVGGGGSQQAKRRELARSMAQHLVQAALLAGSCKNITVMVVLLPGCNID